MKLNLASGGINKEGFINIDKNPKTKCDLVLDITKERLPYENDSVEEVLFSHGPEHIERRYWDFVFMEIKRVLVPNGRFILGYPEWMICAQNYMDAYKTNDPKQEYFLQTIYGRRLWEGDEHVTAVNSGELQRILESYGYFRVKFAPNDVEDPYNTLMVAFKDPQPQCREEVVSDEYGLGKAMSIQTIASEKFG